MDASLPRLPRVLITSGPTHEPIDRVRFLGNRSSGRFGSALADVAAAQGHRTVVLQGPVKFSPLRTDVEVRNFSTCSDLQTLLRQSTGGFDILIMAAAVADYRPKPNPALSGGKFRRTNAPLTLELEPTPDLLAEVSATRQPGQLLVGFALEPRADLLESARAKLERKRIDMVVANPLEAMDSPEAEVTVVYADGRVTELGMLSKAEHAPKVLALAVAEWRRRVGAKG